MSRHLDEKNEPHPVSGSDRFFWINTFINTIKTSKENKGCKNATGTNFYN